MKKSFLFSFLTIALLSSGFSAACEDHKKGHTGGKAQPATKGESGSATATNKITETTFTIEGMSCTSCHAKVISTLKTLDGVYEVIPRAEKNNCTVKYDPKKVNASKLVQTINEKTPYKAKL